MVDRSASVAGLDAPPVRQLVDTLMTRRWLIAGPAIVALMLAVAWLRATPAEYRAVMVVGPTETLDRAAGGDALPSSGGASEVTDFARFLALSTSVAASRRLAAEAWVLPALFPEAWDGSAQRWRPPDGIGPRIERAAAWLLGRDTWRRPGPEALAERLQQRLSVGPMGGSDMRRITLRHRDRATALRLLSLVHATADDLVREAAAARADAQIAYLRGRLVSADLVEHRRALETLLLEQERQRMLIQADLPYAAELLERPSAPTRAGWPNPFLVLVLAATCGVFTGLTLAFAADGLRTAATP